jgi:hypothetical protein
MQFNNPPRKIKNNMTALHLIKSIDRSPLRFAFLLIPLALAIFTSPVDAAEKTHEIDFDKNVPCVGEIVHLKGPIRVSLTFSRNFLTDFNVFVEGITGKGDHSERRYSADPNNKSQSASPPFKVRNEGGRQVGRGQIVVKFLVVGRRQGSSNVKFWAKQVVGIKKDGNVDVDFDPLEVCVLPPQ